MLKKKKEKKTLMCLQYCLGLCVSIIDLKITVFPIGFSSESPILGATGNVLTTCRVPLILVKSTIPLVVQNPSIHSNSNHYLSWITTSIDYLKLTLSLLISAIGKADGTPRTRPQDLKSSDIGVFDNPLQASRPSKLSCVSTIGCNLHSDIVGDCHDNEKSILRTETKPGPI